MTVRGAAPRGRCTLTPASNAPRGGGTGTAPLAARGEPITSSPSRSSHVNKTERPVTHARPALPSVHHSLRLPLRAHIPPLEAASADTTAHARIRGAGSVAAAAMVYISNGESGARARAGGAAGSARCDSGEGALPAGSRRCRGTDAAPSPGLVIAGHGRGARPGRQEAVLPPPARQVSRCTAGPSPRRPPGQESAGPVAERWAPGTDSPPPHLYGPPSPPSLDVLLFSGATSPRCHPPVRPAPLPEQPQPIWGSDSPLQQRAQAVPHPQARGDALDGTLLF